MLEQTVKVELLGSEAVAIKTNATQSNLETLALAAYLRSLPPEQRNYFKKCKLVSFMPVYMPDGMFADNNMHVHKMDPDQLDYAMRAMPEFRTTDESLPANPLYIDLGSKVAQ